MRIQVKGTLISIGIGFLFLLGVGSLLYSATRNAKLDSIQASFEDKLELIEVSLTIFLDEARSDIKILATNELVRTEDDRDFTNFLEANEATFEYHYSDVELEIIDVLNNSRILHPFVNSVYMGRENGSFVRSHPRSAPTQYDPRLRPWYVLAKENPGEVMLTAPYMSVTTRDVNIGVVTTLQDENNNIYGVVGQDITLVNLTDLLSNFDVGHQGYIVLTDENNTILVNTDADLLFEDIQNFLGEHTEEFISKPEGVIRLKDSYIFFITSPSLGWKVSVSIPDEAIASEIRNVVVIPIILTSVMMGMIIVAMLIIQNQLIFKPLNEFYSITQNISKTGNLEQAIKIHNQDEIGILSSSFNQMLLIIKRNLLEKQVLHEIASYAVQAYDEDKLIAYITEILQKTLYSDHMGVLLYDKGAELISLHPSYHGSSKEGKEWTFKPGEGVVGRVVKTKKTINIGDVSETSFYIPEPGLKMRSELCVPILLNDKVYGVLNSESKESNYFSKEDERLLYTVANQLAIGLDKIRLFTQENKLRVEAEIQQEVSMALTESISLEEILHNILKSLQQYLDYDSSSIFLLENGSLRVVATCGFSEGSNLEDMVGFEDDILFQEILLNRAPMILKNANEDERFQNYGDLDHIRGWMGAPLIDQDEVFGFVTFDSSTPGKFTKEMSRLAQILVNQASSAIIKAKLFEQTNIRLKRLQALHEIDLLISSSVDINFTLSQYVQILTDQLSVDAVAVLVFDPFSQTLNYSSSNGFLTIDPLHIQLRIGNGYAGKVALERQIIRIENFEDDDILFTSPLEFNNEHFKTYFGVPLITKGEIKGVLEVFHRSSLIIDQEWEEFLLSLSNQVAIAIENSSLFNDLQRSNLELGLGYEQTIEGWARTLEMRDAETKGHSQRVIDMTMKLAKQMGISPDELVHVRRGALLHDIGKMNVPDSIMQKESQLDDAEWKIMKKHTEYAYDFLSPIKFLEPALDIPRYHHEKWDGTGYPHGLKGEQIPLPARIFAIVDVFDALCSDRPYRKAWPMKKVINHIKEQSGKHFDPAVVKAFLQIQKG